ncbi:porin [Burkholderia cepacia]|uniref:porin n=1 Tax=Burkholderia cepacia TaxID=292 RepID=UPI000757757B|nr:porin [Burkholderia cepacia]KVA54288.1 porin [Burkholderia cepacia]KVA63256.1 porin [Burkholderia cepacia]KVA81891.1 porin [Burkholderia cepacia]KVA90623.1 porin [Burkholderia cepacia]KVA91417.1 porin [Burkholderia cepacia]
MQRKAFLIGACVLSATPAHASSVTLYGIVDSYVEFDRIGSLSSLRQSGGGSSTSRIGLTGVEDLGGGTSTKFVLESGFSPADGSFQGGTLFYRQAYVSLQNTRYGDLRLGRQYTPAFYIVYDGDPFGLNERLSPLALLATSTDTITSNTTPPIPRFNQAASYLSPDWNGLRVMATYGFPTPNALSTQAGRNYGAGLQYRVGGLYLGAGFQGDTSAGNLAPVVSPSTTRHYVFAANYAFARVKLYAAFLYGVGTAPHLPAFSTASAGASINVGALDRVLVSVVRRDVKGSANDATALGVGYDHPLSKRTSLYARYLYVKNGGDARNTVVVGLQPQPGGTGQVFALGLAHRF